MAPDTFQMPDPVFAEWSYYNIDYALLSAHPLDTQCLCSTDSTQCSCSANPTQYPHPTDSTQCAACDDMVLACQRELEKVSSFLHLKGSESEHAIQACEHHMQTITELSADEQLIRLGQIEEAIGATMGQVLALGRFRRSNFTGLWRQLWRVREHCIVHFDELVELLAASPLFGESSLETHQLFRVSQVFGSIQSCYTGTTAPHLAMFPALKLWRGWVDPARVRKVLRLLRRRLVRPNADVPPVGLAHGALSQYGSFPTVNPVGHTSRSHICTLVPPPSPPHTHKSTSPQRTYQSSSSHTSPTPSAKQSSSIDNSSNVCTVYLDTPTLARYHAGLATEASTCNAFSLAWEASNADSSVRISHDTLHGPWFADRRCASAVTLQPHQLLPFLQNELNLNKLAPSQSLPHLPLSPGSDSEHRMRQRDLQRSAQKIQRQIILDDLRPVVLSNEERFEFVDPLAPGLRVVLRTHIRLAYRGRMAECTEAGGQCWLQNVLYNGFESVDAQTETEQLPFGLIEVHLDDAHEQQMPDWLAQLFFESAHIHPVLDFDLYLHAVATLRTRHVTGLPYWMADCYRGPFARSESNPLDLSPRSDPSTRVSPACCHHSPEHSPIDIPHVLPARSLSHAAESTHLLPSPVSRSRQFSPVPHLSSLTPRYCMTLVLAVAMGFSIAISIWPHHHQITQIIVELVDLIVQWVGQLLQHLM
ncbi:vacuolar transporter chaperone [Coemansia sp. RSA 2167]|nr:vacuolar transporter chaperone [Coemansia sp. RSA 2167]KAJ2150390.1 vacuolar transporter chaperone [Coemansia sp. RSA 637]